MRAGFDLKYSVLRLKFDLFHFYGVPRALPVIGGVWRIGGVVESGVRNAR